MNNVVKMKRPETQADDQGKDWEDPSPFNSVPIVPLVLVLVIAGVELTLTAASNGLIGGARGVGWRAGLFGELQFYPDIITQIFERGRGSIDYFKRFVTYPFVHANFTHALWACVLLLALGKFVGEVIKPVAFLILFFLSSAVGALIYGALSWQNTQLIGAYPGVYGLIGAYTYILWLTLGQMGENQLKAFRLIGILLGILLVYSMLFGSSPTWIAEVAGFLTGLFIAPLLAPGGWQGFINRMRKR